MNIQLKEVAKTVLTLGFYGYRKAEKEFEANGLKQRVIFSRQILGLMLALPILVLFTFSIDIFDAISQSYDLPEEIKAWWDYDKPHPPSLIEAVLWIPQAYVLFVMLHLYLGVAFIQHTDGIPPKDRIKVVLFGFYALDRDLSGYLRATDAESDGRERTSGSKRV